MVLKCEGLLQQIAGLPLQSFWFNRSNWEMRFETNKSPSDVDAAGQQHFENHLPGKSLAFRLKCCLHYKAFLYPPPPRWKRAFLLCNALVFYLCLCWLHLVVFLSHPLDYKASEDGFILHSCLYLLQCLVLHFIVKEPCKYVLSEAVYTHM